MGKFPGILVKLVLGLTAAMLLAGVAKAPAALSPTWQQNSRSTVKVKGAWVQKMPVGKGARVRQFVLVEKVVSTPEKPPSPPAPAVEPRQMRKATPPEPQMEKSKSIKPDEDLERAGTKKLGGEVIRSKEE